MTRPIEAVAAEAQARLASSGELDVAAFISANPEHALELSELLPVMIELHKERVWQTAANNSRTFGVSLFAQLCAPPDLAPAGVATVGDLFAEERLLAGLSVEEQARRSGLPVPALEQLSTNRTPVSLLGDNTTLKQIAAQAAAPFGALVKEVRRLLSLKTLGGMNAGALFTRDKETSTEAERQALLEKVRESSRKPPEGE